ncbi:LIM homeobox transcription factor 1-alpha [Corythoichthys intestinalis]|uniref:LIM homeobox transcription factor 1-alpha n=1 Tax=Corythoichthys intestinalis TaxID=161448 RepID=UPI0025A54693|nr:LIM homeobox transcription factor 1-alpha [Corythoichthys intestinalis]XP_057696549.1 LIM homeobox transcription factor 1-alpha [Corythoichthys intestinalis]XP_061790480.1 LIM homeobox transcription factor 1-alpha-like [Nerophis lumbriciformis]
MQHRPVCAGCHRPIADKFLLRVADGLRHEACARCSACGRALKDSCFVREQRLYCKRDYAELFPVRCGGCSETISPTELVLRAGPAIFHLRCFTCSVCGTPLRTGDRCVLREGRLMCTREDYHRRTCSPTSSDTGKSEDVDEDDEEMKERLTRRPTKYDEQESKRPKRPRTILTTQQRRIFKASFEVSSKPCRKVRETLAADTGLTVRVVQVWFQNQRAKMKKLARRQQQQEQDQPTQEQQEQPSHLKAPSNGVPNTQLEHMGPSYSHGQHQQQMGFTGVEQQDFDPDHFRQGLTPPQMPGDHMHPYGLQALYGDTMDTDCTSLGDASSLLTPIDCLYSMQDSYFTS